MSTVRFLGLSVAFLFIAGSAGAATITFNGVNGAGNPTVTLTQDGGFDFSSGHHHNATSGGSFGGVVSNGTTYLGEEDGALGQNITMSRTGGGTFTLNGFDVAELFNNAAAAAVGGFPNAEIIQISGSNGTTVAFALDGANGFETIGGLGGAFSNVTSVTFAGLLFSGAGGGIGLDNIVVDRTMIPEPSSAILFGAAWLVAGVTLRRKAA